MHQQIQDVRIASFRALDDLAITDARLLNILVGKNDVGKTSVLEAIFLVTGIDVIVLPIQIQNLRNYVIRDITDLIYLFNGLNTDRSIVLKATLTNPAETRTLKLSAAGQSQEDVPVTQLIGRGGSPDGRKYGSENSVRTLKTSIDRVRYLDCDAHISRDHDDKPIEFGGSIRVQSAEDIKPSTWGIDENRDFTIPAVLLRPSATYPVALVADLIVNKETDELLGVLQDANFDIRGLAVKDDTVFVDCGFERMIPINMFGDGLVRAISILAHCIRGQFRVLLIDEIDSGLHYTTMTVFLSILMRLAQRAGVQIFATTHSLDILKTLQTVLADDENSGFRDQVVCYALSKGADGSVSSFPYLYQQFDHCIASGIEFR